MRAIKFLLPPKARFHFGKGKNKLAEKFASDRLFSALINKIALIYPEKIESIIDNFKDGKIKISSLNYGLDFSKNNQDVKTIYFLPKPLALGQDLQNKKEWKKVKYLSLEVFQEVLNSWDKKEERFTVQKVDYQEIGDSFIVKNSELAALEIAQKEDLTRQIFVKLNNRPRLKINRFTANAEQYFYQQYLEINKEKIGAYEIKPFFYFLYQGNLDDKMKAALRLLADEGLGGERSKGLGLLSDIKFIQEDLLKSENEEYNYYLNLSTVLPQKEETSQLKLYNLDKRDGYIYDLGGTFLRKKTIRIITEGSIFTGVIKGKIAGVAPVEFDKHNIYLNGKALNVGFGGVKNEV